MPDESTYGFSRGDAELIINGLGGGDVEIPGRGASSAATIKHAYPPVGGLPVATWDSVTETMTPGVAECRVAIRVGGAYEPTTATLRVENPVGAIVGISGKPITIGRNTSGAWTVLVEDCTGVTTTLAESPSGDAGDSGSSNAIDMGYTLGV